MGLGGVGVASADPIEPGYDLFFTEPSTTHVTMDFGGGPQNIPLMGYRPPVIALFTAPLNNPAYNDTDTIVQRHAGIDPLPVGGSGIIPIELVALSLVSVNPVLIGPDFYDLSVLGGALLTPSTPSLWGSMTVNHEVPNGGTFTASLPVHATITFTQVGNPLNTFPVPFLDTFTSSGIWSHTPRFDDVHIDPPFPAGNFYPGVDPHTSQKVLTVEESLLAAHGVLPAQTPEPGSLTLIAGALLLFARRPRGKGVN